MNNQQPPANTGSPATSVNPVLDDIMYDHILELPVYKSSIKRDWFTEGKDGLWYYMQTDIHGISRPTILFPMDIQEVTIVDPDKFGRFNFMIVNYFSGSSSPLSTVIPFTQFMKKKLQEYFFLPAGFRITNSKDNVVNEFLFFLILNCGQQHTISTYPFQGWNINITGSVEFECQDRYPEVFKQYLPPSISQRSFSVPFGYSERLLPQINNILPASWEFKLLVALRISSLTLRFCYMNQLRPKQLFVLETTKDANTTLISALLKTNNSSDIDILNLNMAHDKLLKRITDISDGIALIYDFESDEQYKNLSSSLSELSNHLIKSSYELPTSKQIITVLSSFSQYGIAPERYYTLNYDKLSPNYDYSQVVSLIKELDASIISFFNLKNIDDALKSYKDFLIIQKNKPHDPIPSEVQDTFYMVNTAMELFNYILFKESGTDLSQPYVTFFTEEDKNNINSFLTKIDRSGQYTVKRIIDSFTDQLNNALTNHFKCMPLSGFIKYNITDEIVLTDSDYVYIAPTALDTFIIPNMDIAIKHRPLVKTLHRTGILSGGYHYCCRIQYLDASSQPRQLYRYKISRDILSKNSQIAINKAEGDEFFHQLSSVKSNNFIPFVKNETADAWAGRIIETGAKANNHMLITGESASGKSYFMIRTAAYLAEAGERVIILDSSGSNTLSELEGALSKEFVKNNIEIFNLEKQGFPIDPFSIAELGRKDSKANHIFSILRSAVYDATDAQNAKLKTLIFENIVSLEKNGKVSPEDILDLLKNDGSTITALRDKLLPLLVSLSGHINYEKTWGDYLNTPQKILVFSVDTVIEKQGKKLFDILLASLYLYHTKHRYSSLWLCIDEIFDQNLKEDGIINMIFTQGRKSKINIIGATQGFELSHSEEWSTLNNAKTKVFFKPISTSIPDVMKELNMTESKRHIFAKMQQQECIISSELYSKKTKSNQPAIVHGKVPEKYTPFKEILQPPPNYGAGPAAPAEEKKKESIDSVQPDTNPTSPISENDIKFGQNTRIGNIPVPQTYKPLYEQEKINRTSFTVPSWNPSLAEHSYKNLIYLEQNKTHNTNSWIKPYTKDDNNKK